METRSPTVGRIAIALVFALSCFGLLLFLWVTFGGPVPLKSKSYRVHVPVTEATQLAVESDVRISGVSVGKVKQIELGDTGSFADATIELDAKYAPIPADTRAILRQKTLLGETYVELTPGSQDGPTLPEDGALPEAQVSDAVQLDEIFRTFDPETRAAFQSWMQNAAVAFRGRGVDLNAALGNLTPFAERADDLLRVLDGQSLAVQQLIRDGGTTFDALSERPEALQGLITNSEEVFSTTAARDAELADLFRVLPTFLDESKLTLERLDRFAADTDPLVTQLRPAAKELSGTLRELQTLSPVLEQFFDGLPAVSRNAARGFGSLRTVLDDQLPPPLARVDSYFDELIPAIETIYRFRREVTAFLANTASATNGFTTPPETNARPVKYIRTTGVLGPDVLASYPDRLKVNRVNPYVEAGGYTKLAQSLESFVVEHCTSGTTATLTPGAPGDLPGDLYERIQLYAFGGPGNTNSDAIPAPPCTQQGPQKSIGGSSPGSSDFLQVRPQP
jgi:virulence factor Mce-like protein